MKKNVKFHKNLLNLITTDVPAKKLYHGDDQLIDKLVNPQNGETIKKIDYKKVGALALAPAIIAGSISYAQKKTSNLPLSTNTKAFHEEITTSLPPSITTYIANFNGQPYYFLPEEYVINLANDSLNRMQKLLTEVNGITPVGTISGEFYPEYFNPYLLAALCHTESSYRLYDSAGNLLKSSSGALGLTQVTPQAIIDLNEWLHKTLNLKHISYSIDDLKDPAKAMDITTLILIQICKNHGKVGCNNPLYTYLHESFSLDRQQEIILAIYNNGYNNMFSYVKNGTI